MRFLLFKEDGVQLSAANGVIKKGTQGQKYDQFTQGDIESIEQETAAKIIGQFRTYQQTVEQGGHQQACQVRA